MGAFKKWGQKKFNKNVDVFLIAEAGCNFEGNLSRAEEMIREAARGGADAIKFQTFIPEKLVTRDAPKFWDIQGCPGETQYEEFGMMPHLSHEEYIHLKKIADENRIHFFSTPSDEESADLLENVGVPFYKISSMDLTHVPLLKHIAKKGKPIILSTGASDLYEIQEAVSIIEAEGNSDIILLHCITNYPTAIENVNLNMMLEIMRAFPDYPVGYSDHTTLPGSMCVISAAVALGASVIEKHFTFDRTRLGYDHEISMDYCDLKKISRSIDLVKRSLGSNSKKPVESELESRKWARRSLVAVTNIPKGCRITAEMLAVKRPGTGIPPKFFDSVIGAQAIDDIIEDTVLLWKMITCEKEQQ